MKTAIPFMPGALYKEVYGTYVPRACVDVVIYTESDGVVLVLRKDPPIGIWHLPGGTIYKGESLFKAATRLAKRETNIDISQHFGFKVIGTLEMLCENMEVEIAGEKVPVQMHNIMTMVQVRPTSFDLKSANDEQVRWFKSVPTNVEVWHPHIEFLVEKGLLNT
jgi:8-oxo-dGTP pyrophosphatase MutT (NUDIX family)